MVVRATEAEIDVVRTNPNDAVKVFEESVIPALHEQEGYRGLYVLLSEEGKMLVLSFWESDEAARATRLSGFYQEQIEKFSDLVFFRQAPGREAYDVVVAETPAEVVA
ncbi:MAG TPA: antibiotic biosynthesis monooxygenase [Gaiellaceae bacterium]|nr:antibiotic biosynthesis monooxygenase [Gaiellaceae bacterium]